MLKSKYKIFLFILIFNILFIPTLFANSNINLTSQEKQWLHNHRPIKMCVLPDWMPFEQIDENNKHNGIGSDLIKLVSEYINTPIVLVPTKSWAVSLENIKKKV